MEERGGWSTNGEWGRLILYAKMNQNPENRDLDKEVSSYQFVIDTATGRMLRGTEDESRTVSWNREIPFVNSHASPNCAN